MKLDELERGMPPAVSLGLYVRPSHVAVEYDDMRRLLALARAGERLFGAGKELEVAATTNNLEDIPDCILALDASLAAWKEAWDGT